MGFSRIEGNVAYYDIMSGGDDPKLLRSTRHSELFLLHKQIRKTVNDRSLRLPRKTLYRSVAPAWVERRRQGIEHYLRSASRDARVCALPAWKKFFGSEVNAMLAIRPLLVNCSHKGWKDLPTHRDLRKCAGIELDVEGFVVSLELRGTADQGLLSGNLPEVFHEFSRLSVIDLSFSKDLVGLPDFSNCPALIVADLKNCGFTKLPQSWPPLLRILDLSGNTHLTGATPDLIKHCHVLQVVSSESCGCSAKPLSWSRSRGLLEGFKKAT